MEKQKKEFRKTENNIFADYKEVSLSDYYNFNLQNLAQKIKMQDYKPKPKMLYL